MPVLEAFLYFTIMAIIGHDVLGYTPENIWVPVGASIGLVAVRQALSGFIPAYREAKAKAIAEAEPEPGPKKPGPLS